MQNIDPRDIRLQAMNLLSRREHLRRELRDKLLRQFGPGMEADIEATLDSLERERLLSDQRYAESYLVSRSGKGYGPERIRQELRQKGADGELIAIAFDGAAIDWVALARQARCKKFGEKPPLDFKEKARQLRFLTYRGFGSEFASEALTRPSEES
jgi:regulatory protein